jgi:NAD dependent epimerase/dehydratase family enzyme
VVHISSPQPISNRDIMATLRKQLRRPNLPATPAWAISLGARFIFRTDAALALTGRRAIPQKLLDSGFIFEHPDFDDALRVLLQGGKYRK